MQLINYREAGVWFEFHEEQFIVCLFLHFIVSIWKSKAGNLKKKLFYFFKKHANPNVDYKTCTNCLS